ncbi:hypothetical protein PoB_007409700 [Plakobranchus ocellatus]|uniref:Uncharacterized protein n=1 Tax=Plakobranchus ocellatus TaxID=259542 RepID=A0AAV4DTA8_9GAST|nr:hypothetical protein PoB_007409700 [Plakobranchus ocellatus]
MSHVQYFHVEVFSFHVSTLVHLPPNHGGCCPRCHGVMLPGQTLIRRQISWQVHKALRHGLSAVEAKEKKKPQKKSSVRVSTTSSSNSSSSRIAAAALPSSSSSSSATAAAAPAPAGYSSLTTQAEKVTHSANKLTQVCRATHRATSNKATSQIYRLDCSKFIENTILATN